MKFRIIQGNFSLLLLLLFLLEKFAKKHLIKSVFCKKTPFKIFFVKKHLLRDFLLKNTLNQFSVTFVNFQALTMPFELKSQCLKVDKWHSQRLKVDKSQRKLI